MQPDWGRGRSWWHQKAQMSWMSGMSQSHGWRPVWAIVSGKPTWVAKRSAHRWPLHVAPPQAWQLGSEREHLSRSLLGGADGLCKGSYDLAWKLQSITFATFHRSGEPLRPSHFNGRTGRHQLLISMDQTYVLERINGDEKYHFLYLWKI